MTTDTEALRAQFERRMNLRGWSEANIRRDGLDYSSTQITEAWHAYQAGYAAAKAETAAAVAKERERAFALVDGLADGMMATGMVSASIVTKAVAKSVRDGDAIRAGAKNDD